MALNQQQFDTLSAIDQERYRVWSDRRMQAEITENAWVTAIGHQRYVKIHGRGPIEVALKSVGEFECPSS